MIWQGSLARSGARGKPGCVGPRVGACKYSYADLHVKLNQMQVKPLTLTYIYVLLSSASGISSFSGAASLSGAIALAAGSSDSLIHEL